MTMVATSYAIRTSKERLVPRTLPCSKAILYHDEGIPAPELKFESTGLWVIFETGQVTGQVQQSMDWIAKVLNACASGPLKSSEIQSIVGIKHRETFQKNYLGHLLEQNLLERTIPDKCFYHTRKQSR